MKRIFLVFSVISVIAMTRCSTDVELSAPYDSSAVIFGLLDPGLDTQWVKINRTWLGDGNNIEIAAIRDSSEYADGAFVATVERWQGGNIVQTYNVNDTILDNKDTDGIFFAPEYKAYYFLSPGGLNTDSEYRLNLDFPGSDDVEATTNVIDIPPGAVQFPISPEDNAQFPGVQFAAVSQLGTTYYTQNFDWIAADNASRYEAKLRIYVKEYVYTDDTWSELESTRDVELEWFVGTQNVDPETTLSVGTDVNGQGFYQFLAANFDPDPRVRRELGYWDSNIEVARVFDFIVTMANDELDTYLDINEPVTNIVQERPNYTNVSNGIGLWASRATMIVEGVEITEGSIVALVQGEFTADLNFCSPNPNNAFYCGE